MPLGVVAGYVGGWVDDVIMRITDVFLAFPALLLSLALAAVLSPSVGNASLAIAVDLVALVRAADPRAGAAIQVRGRGYVESGARARGAADGASSLRHVLPNALTPVLVQLSLDVGGVILTAAALSFLGLGAQDPTPEWGLMVSQGQALFDDATGGSPCSRARRSCSTASASTCSATACARRSTRGEVTR